MLKLIKKKITWKIVDINFNGLVTINFDQQMNNSVNISCINETNTQIYVQPANHR